jgi:hypothetical protein
MGLIPAAFAVDLLDLEPSTHPADEHVSTWLTHAGTRASTRDSRTVQWWKMQRPRAGNGSVPLR